MTKSKKSATHSQAKTSATSSKSSPKGKSESRSTGGAAGGATSPSVKPNTPGNGSSSAKGSATSKPSPPRAGGKVPPTAPGKPAAASREGAGRGGAGVAVPASRLPSTTPPGSRAPQKATTKSATTTAGKSGEAVSAPKPSGNGKVGAKGVGASPAGPLAKKPASGAVPGSPPKGAASKSGALGKSGAGGKKKAAPEAPPRPAVPRKFPKGGPGKAEIRKYRAHLLELRRALLASSKDLASEALKSGASEFSVDHMADNGSDNYEQDFSLQLLEGEAAQLNDIREALLKIDGKAELPYGVCEACSDVDKRLCETCPYIPPSRLEVMPHARLCVQTKEIEERRKQR